MTSLRMHPSIPAIVFVIFWIVASIVFPDRMLNADGDMLRHIRHGEEMLRTGSLIHADPFSFTRGGDPFVGFEYGSQIIYALVHRAAGLAGVAIFAGLLIATAYCLLARFLMTRRVDALLAYLVSIAAAVLGAVHWSPRPHLFTLVFVMVLLGALEESPVGRPRWLYLGIALLFAVWANLHGGFVYGLTLFAIYFAGSVLEMLRTRRDPVASAAWRGRAVHYAKLGAIGLAATILTPHGLELHRHIIAFFGEPFLMENTQEFFSPDFHTAGGKLLMVALLGIMTAFALAPGRPAFTRLLLLLANVAFALQSRRNIPLFGATVLPVLALHFDAAWRSLPDWRGIRAVFERDAARGRTLPLVGITALGFAAIAALGGRVGSVAVVPNALSPREFPIEAVERLRSERFDGRLFHDFVWGGYILYAWPEQKVYIDGGTDFYGTELMASHMKVVGMQPGWREILERWRIDGVLMPTGSAMLYELARDGSWTLRYCDRTAVLLERGAPATPVDAAALDRCRA